jgi:hypothetical protein
MVLSLDDLVENSEDVGELCRLSLNKGRQTDHLPHGLGGCDVPDRRRFDADGWTPLRIAEGVSGPARTQRRV